MHGAISTWGGSPTRLYGSKHTCIMTCAGSGHGENPTTPRPQSWHTMYIIYQLYVFLLAPPRWKKTGSCAPWLMFAALVFSPHESAVLWVRDLSFAHKTRPPPFAIFMLTQASLLWATSPCFMRTSSPHHAFSASRPPPRPWPIETICRPSVCAASRHSSDAKLLKVFLEAPIHIILLQSKEVLVPYTHPAWWISTKPSITSAEFFFSFFFQVYWY